MRKAMAKRLEKLERGQPDGGRWHQIFGEEGEELDRLRAELMASPAWQESDHLIEWTIPAEGKPHEQGPVASS